MIELLLIYLQILVVVILAVNGFAVFEEELDELLRFEELCLEFGYLHPEVPYINGPDLGKVHDIVLWLYFPISIFRETIPHFDFK